MTPKENSSNLKLCPGEEPQSLQGRFTMFSIEVIIGSQHLLIEENIADLKKQLTFTVF